MGTPTRKKTDTLRQWRENNALRAARRADAQSKPADILAEAARVLGTSSSWPLDVYDEKERMIIRLMALSAALAAKAEAPQP